MFIVKTDFITFLSNRNEANLIKRAIRDSKTKNFPISIKQFVNILKQFHAYRTTDKKTITYMLKGLKKYDNKYMIHFDVNIMVNESTLRECEFTEMNDDGVNTSYTICHRKILIRHNNYCYLHSGMTCHICEKEASAVCEKCKQYICNDIDCTQMHTQQCYSYKI